METRRYFNTEGQCNPKMHYMVRLDDRIRRIKLHFVDRGKYFVINRGRQYGKTTTLMELAEHLREDYTVLYIDFQMLSTESFENENRFSVSFTRHFLHAMAGAGEKMESREWKELLASAKDAGYGLDEMFGRFSKICGIAAKPIVLMIDEADSASNHRVFLDFLSMLRGYYLDRNSRPVFYSVILAGVYDIKNLRLKIRSETDHKYNSPWNIAARFHVDMSFSAGQIASMLQEYDADYKTGMNAQSVAECIYEYTSGYPYLVSAICKFMDEEIYGTKGFEEMAALWSPEGVAEAVKLLLKEESPLFGSMVKQLDRFRDLRDMLEDMIYQGKSIPYSPDVESVSVGVMFGFLKEENGQVAVANRIFEMRLLNMFSAEEAVKSETYRCGQRDRKQFVSGAKLNMELVLEKFVQHFTDVYGGDDDRFIEKCGRKIFLLYLKPIINGVGNYYVEAQTRDAKRTDVIVDYLGEQFIVELKIWHGKEYNEREEKQLAGYLDYFRQNKGYMLSFNFNKKKDIGVHVITVGDKRIVEAVV